MSSTTSTPPTVAPLNLNNVQGDILVGLAKKTETYLFFEIVGDVSVFRKQLSRFLPSITSSTQASQQRDQISKHKKAHGDNQLLKISAINIAFSQTGVTKIGITDDIGDSAFKNGMLRDAQNLGDTGTTSPTGTFTPNWLPAFKSGTIDGLIIIAGDCHATVHEEFQKIEEIFLVNTPHPAIKEVFTVIGDVRPGAEKGHEHFGFLDGISQPAVQDVDTKPNPGQETVPQGKILVGRESDSVSTRPPWALDGSFLSFRYLSQLVPEFNLFCQDNAVPGLPKQQGADFFGARMVGRWKSGTPIDLAPLKDDPTIGANPLKNNDFNYSFPEDINGQDRCPFAAHLRKTNPRFDLENGNPTATIDRRIIRRGIQFGPEVTSEEAHKQKTLHDRGLLFAAYSSSITNGFQFIQHSWANNINFIFNKTTPTGQTVVPGFDPIIGQPSVSGGPRTTLGLQPQGQDLDTPLPIEWVVSKGGEYFFTPSIPALKNTFALPVPKTEL